MSELEKYIKIVEKQIKDLQKLECTDRLDLQAGIEECIQHINASTLGWAKWVASAKIMKTFSNEDLKKYFETMRKIAEEFLKLDVEASELFLQKQKEKAEKEVNEAKKAEKSKQSYVA